MHAKVLRIVIVVGLIFSGFQSIPAFAITMADCDANLRSVLQKIGPRVETTLTFLDADGTPRVLPTIMVNHSEMIEDHFQLSIRVSSEAQAQAVFSAIAESVVKVVKELGMVQGYYQLAMSEEESFWRVGGIKGRYKDKNLRHPEPTLEINSLNDGIAMDAPLLYQALRQYHGLNL